MKKKIEKLAVNAAIITRTALSAAIKAVVMFGDALIDRRVQAKTADLRCQIDRLVLGMVDLEADKGEIEFQRDEVVRQLEAERVAHAERVADADARAAIAAENLTNAGFIVKQFQAEAVLARAEADTAIAGANAAKHRATAATERRAKAEADKSAKMRLVHSRKRLAAQWKRLRDAQSEQMAMLRVTEAEKPVEHEVAPGNEDVTIIAAGAQVVEVVPGVARRGKTKHKKCKRCGLVKPATDFHRNASSRDGLRYKCIECEAEIRAERLSVNLSGWAFRNWQPRKLHDTCRTGNDR